MRSSTEKLAEDMSTSNQGQINQPKKINGLKSTFFRGLFAACLVTSLIAVAVNTFILVQIGAPLILTIIAALAGAIASWFASYAILTGVLSFCVLKQAATKSASNNISNTEKTTRSNDLKATSDKASEPQKSKTSLNTSNLVRRNTTPTLPKPKKKYKSVDKGNNTKTSKDSINEMPLNTSRTLS